MTMLCSRWFKNIYISRLRYCLLDAALTPQHAQYLLLCGNHQSGAAR
jgi:hypothetical protein